MPAALRGGPRIAGQPRAKAPSSSKASTRRAPARPTNAAKLHAAKGVGLPPRAALAAAGGLLILGVIVSLATGHRGERLAATLAAGGQGVMADAGFRLKTIHVQGATGMAQPDILRAAEVYKGDPILGLDLDALRNRVQAVGWVQEVRVVRLLPDTLVLAVEQRRPVAVWQRGGRTAMIDDAGRVIEEADPARFPALPLVVGEGADQAASPILNALSQRPDLLGRVEALVRVDQRRWDLRLKDGTLVQLPATDEESALIRLDRLAQGQRILDLGLARIDLRNPEFLAVRPAGDAGAGGVADAGGAD
jgi:cell division protein FtsQ